MRVKKMKNKRFIKSIPIVLFLLLFAGCATTIPKEALQLSPESLQLRQLQTKRYDTDEKTLLSASAALVQDLGFNIDETTTEAGVITCSKHREAISVGQIVGALVVAVFTGAATPVDKSQLIRASVVTRPVHTDETDKSKCQTAVRVTFQRVVTNTANQITRRECIVEEGIYKEFFDKLSQSLFLEAHEL
jgi:hypothetical protein